MLSYLNVALYAIGGGAIGWLLLATVDHLGVLLNSSEEHPDA
ncbi:hypothetical protein [Streptomyces sp. NBC_00035]